VIPPPTTMMGALLRYLREADPAHFQPMNSNFGLVEPLADAPRDKQRRREMLVERAQSEFGAWAEEHGLARAEAAPTA
jgi:methylenetetrahydrofolate--tRNA-(uracil-5-)-methyltransferase